MFKSATLKLTGWYLLILMTVSIIFSIVTYNIANNEVQTRLEHFQTHMQEFTDFIPPPIGMTDFRRIEIDTATSNLAVELLYANLFILIIGGFGSYFMARRSLAPIEKAHKAQSQFTSDASHELRTPLAVMKTELEVALNDNSSTKKDLQNVITSSIEEVDKLSKLSEMLLSLSMMDNSKLELKPVDLVKITHSVIAKINRVTLISEKIIMIKAEETVVYDMLKALIDNAVQYSPDDSKILIKLSQDEKQAKLEITNSGKGIDPEKLPYIFDRFYRADSSRTAGNHKGYGLGLALVKNIVELLKGEIKVTSSTVEGTTFIVLLNKN